MIPDRRRTDDRCGAYWSAFFRSSVPDQPQSRLVMDKSKDPQPSENPDQTRAEAAAGSTDGRLPSSAMRSYALLTPDLKNLYLGFYKATYGKTRLDLKTKEFIAIAASLVSGCKGCLEGHLKKAKKEGATAEEVSEVIAITLGVAAASIVDRSDIANFHLGGLFDKPE
jgi:AhpD family alkylhydroperoxidase